MEKNSRNNDTSFNGKMKKYLTPINLVFSASLFITILIAFGIISREFAFLVFGLYGVFMVVSSLEKSVSLFLRSIPFFIALPIVFNVKGVFVELDNFNMWRIFALILFIRWMLEDARWRTWLKESLDFLSSQNKFSIFIDWFKKNKIEASGILFLIIMGLSVIVGQGAQFAIGAGFASVKRFIFVLNGVFLFLVISSLVKKNSNNFFLFCRDFAYSGLLAVFFGFVQFIAAYFQPAWVFHYWWGQVVSLGMYGKEWANISTNFGNTWFSYSGNTLRLRMFSTFPDSHSFPMYVIMTLPAMFVVGFSKIKNFLFFKKESFKIIDKKLLLDLLILSLINLALIFSGTRGIWIASIVIVFVAGIFWLFNVEKRYIKASLALLVLFLSMFPVYFGVVSFPQFQDTSFDSEASLGRIRSIVDFGETSNEGRIEIWKTTIEFMVNNPALSITGVGVGNYPIILSEPISSLRAGASAHNWYLHLASTIGIPGLLAFLWFSVELTLRQGINFIKKHNLSEEVVFMVLAIISYAWIAAYLMTDAALYDERAMLAFMAMTGISMGLIKKEKMV